MVNTMVCIGIFFCIFASTGYLCFGENVSTSISLDLEGTSALLVQGAYLVAVSLSYPLMMLPAVQIFEQTLCLPLLRGNDASIARYSRQNFARALIVFATVSVAYSCKRELDGLLAFVGALCGIPLSFLFPALAHQKLVGGSDLEDWIIIGVATLMMGTSIVVSVLTWAPETVE